MDMCVHAHMYVHVLVHTCAVYLLCVHTYVRVCGVRARG